MSLCSRRRRSRTTSRPSILAQIALNEVEGLVPMGQIAASLGVVPGTATTMIKALSESGLVHYEPYMGVRLTAAGEKLAGLVLRRHRLMELFLVKVLGMSWAEVHDEAEQLEHAVSERLIDRIDEMLGRPTVDPHGDPIPTPEGRLPRVDHVEPVERAGGRRAGRDARHRSGSGIPALRRTAPVETRGRRDGRTARPRGGQHPAANHRWADDHNRGPCGLQGARSAP